MFDVSEIKTKNDSEDHQDERLQAKEENTQIRLPLNLLEQQSSLHSLENSEANQVFGSILDENSHPTSLSPEESQLLIQFREEVNKVVEHLVGEIVHAVKHHVPSPKEVEVALKIQGIFTEPMSNSSHGYLAKSIRDSFLDDFHRKLYHSVLKPYKRPANRGSITAFFTGYLSVRETLQKWQSRFIHALTVIDEELRPLKEQDSWNFEFQLSLINACLFSNLKSMCSEMDWHEPACRLFVEMAPRNLNFLREPLKLTDNNEVHLVTDKTQAVEAFARAARAEKKLAKDKDKLAKDKDKLSQSEDELPQSEDELKANARSVKYKARAAEAEVLVRKNEKIITLLEKGKTPSQQSPLIENSLFKASGGGNIIEGNRATEGSMAEFSSNSTLQ